MKRFLIGVLLFVFIPNVYAISLGTALSSENYDGWLETSSSQQYTVKSGGKHTIGVYYDEEDISKIDININVSQGISVSSSSSELGSNDTLSGSGGNYTINIINTEEEDDISGAGVFPLSFPSVSGLSEITITASARAYDANGSLKETQNITVKYNVLSKSTNCDNNMDVSVTIDNNSNIQKIDSIFGPEYDYTTNNGTASIRIVPNSSKAVIAYLGDSISFSSDNPPRYAPNIDLNNQNLNYGENGYVFSIMSECAKQSDEISSKLTGVPIIGGIDWYQDAFYSSGIVAISIKRNDIRSKDNTLKSLTISDVSMSDFNKDLKTYMKTVPYKVSSVKINALLSDNKASFVQGFGNRNVSLNEGMNDVLIKVRAENGEEAVYTIKINRELNDDASLRTIKVDDNEIKIKKDVLKYSIKVDNAVTKPNVVITPTYESSKIEKEEIEELIEGSNIINITVTASNGNKLIYVLDIIRDSLISTNSKLKNIKIKNHELKFESDKNTYDIHITSEEEKLDLEIIPESDKAKYVVIGNKELKNGSQIKIKVTAEDEETISNYTINITKDAKPINILFIIIPLLITIIVVVFFIIKKIKSKKNVESKSEKNKVDDIKNNESTINEEKNDDLVTSEEIKNEDNKE